MASRRVLRSVLCNFLGTYTSRYSDYGGYWLLGFLVPALDDIELDLLRHPTDASEVLGSAHGLAVREFADQLMKSGLDPSHVTNARLHVDQLSASRQNDRSGWTYRLRATATADTGRSFDCETVIFVAPHDPRFEHRSGRWSWTQFRRRRVQGRLDE